MLNQTTVTAIQALLFIVLEKRSDPIPPGEIAAHLGASPAYLSKINTQLAKSNILRAHRGTKGGVTLERPPDQITLLQIVEACQGMILGDYCQECDDLEIVCAFHRAMYELQQALVGTLQRWSLADLASKPLPHESILGQVECRAACAVRQPE